MLCNCENVFNQKLAYVEQGDVIGGKKCLSSQELNKGGGPITFEDGGGALFKEEGGNPQNKISSRIGTAFSSRKGNLP